jgi:hypothetical protein
MYLKGASLREFVENMIEKVTMILIYAYAAPPRDADAAAAWA